MLALHLQLDALPLRVDVFTVKNKAQLCGNRTDDCIRFMRGRIFAAGDQEMAQKLRFARNGTVQHQRKILPEITACIDRQFPVHLLSQSDTTAEAGVILDARHGVFHDVIDAGEIQETFGDLIDQQRHARIFLSQLRLPSESVREHAADKGRDQEKQQQNKILLVRNDKSKDRRGKVVVEKENRGGRGEKSVDITPCKNGRKENTDQKDHQQILFFQAETVQLQR